MSSLRDEQAFEGRIGYQFSDRALLRRALTHGSFGDGKAVADNERMEFLGDRVLGLIVADLLFQSDARPTEGQMARKLNALVRKEACADAARAAGIGQALYMSKAEENNGGRDKLSILGDACEAVMAALYLDGSMKAAEDFFNQFWAEQLAGLSGSNKDPKSQLQEWALANGQGLPKYLQISRKGPDHRPVFTVSVNLGQQTSSAEGSTKQNAERAAAKNMLEQMTQNNE